MKVLTFSFILTLGALSLTGQSWDWVAGSINAWTEETPDGGIYLHIEELTASQQPPGSTAYDEIKYFWDYVEDPGPGEDGFKYLSNTDFPNDSKYFTINFPTYKKKIKVGAKYIWKEQSGTHFDYTELIEVERPVLSMEIDTFYNCPPAQFLNLSPAPTVSFPSSCSYVFYNGEEIEFNFYNCLPGNRNIKIYTPLGSVITHKTKANNFYFQASPDSTGQGVYFIEVTTQGGKEPFKIAIF